MGRPPIGERAMTAAERQRRRRAKAKEFRDSEPVTKPAAPFRDDQRVTEPAAEFRDSKRVTELEQALATARAEIETLRLEVGRLTGDPPVGSDKGTLQRAEAMLILRCLHPDNSASSQARHDAFIAFRQIANKITMSDAAEQQRRKQAEDDERMADLWRRRHEQYRQRSERSKAAWAKRREAAPNS